MRTVERMKALKKWAEDNLCKGRRMKSPSSDWNISKIEMREPKVYLAWTPLRMNQNGTVVQPNTANVTPGIIIMPSMSYAKMIEEKRFDRYQGVHRPVNLGNQLSISMLFSIYEPGTRLPGFIDSCGPNGEGMDMTLFEEGTEQGLFTLLDWIDDAKTALLRDMSIPKTDLFLNEQTLAWSLYTDQEYVTDRRPVYYGFINCTFGGFVDEGKRPINELLN